MAKDPDIISKAVIKVDEASELERMREDYAILLAELDSEKGRNDSQVIRAQMMKPFADKTFRFVCCYCLITALLIVASGAIPTFEIPVPVQSIIAGSTAVAAIGLVSIVVSGLFRSSGGKGD